MTNVSVLLFDLKTGRSSSTVQVRLLRFLKAMNVCRGGELMGVDMLLLDSQATMMPATMNFNRLATHMPNLKSSSVYSLTVFDVTQCNQNYRLSDSVLIIHFSDSNSFNEDKNRVMATINMENDMYVTMSFFDSQAVKMHNQQEKMRGDPRVVVATSVNPKMVGGHLFLNATSGTHIYFDKETAVGESFFYMLVAQDTGLTPASPRLRGYAKVESLSIAELNNFVTTAPSQEIDFVCTGRVTGIKVEKGCAYATIVSHDGRAITIDGHRRVLLSGSIHYPRSTPEMWPDLIKKGKEGGLDAIETYVFWNAHEPTRRQYDFSGKLDLIRFLKTIQDEGLYGVLRIGPYACAEWNYGGFPVWLHNMPGMVFRTTNKSFMDEMQNFTTMIVDMVKKEKLFASQGGPIILAQIENEYGNVMGPYGDSGKAYIKWCANMAQSLDVGVPWIMCQQNDAPQPMLNTCNGFYCDNFVPNNPNTPKMWTENWTGWFKQWGGKNPHRTTEDVAFSVARFFQRGGTFNNYYMYHGGTNFDRTAGGPYITTSYDYDAPLDEYGNLNQPKYGHLKQLHDVLHSMERTLTYGNISTIDFGNSASATIYKTEEGSSCFFGNGNENSDAKISFQGESYVIPAWSVTILPDCKNEAYNTAKITTQTSMMVKKPNEAEDTPSTLKWSWRPENVDNFILKGKGESTQTQLFDQKVVTNDQSDYLCMSLRVNSTAHVLHAFVNGKHIGNQHAEDGKFNYVFEKDVKFKSGRNVIALLSITVGLANYGIFFESKPAGITGPIFITGRNGDETIVKDLSAHKWSYKTGLNGFENQLFRTESMSKWSVESVPFNRTMTWYKATFKAPLGNDPVVVDLMGLGKGTAWVNGNNIGRYWPAFISSENGCDAKCNYRGAYHAEKCLTNCGEPTQRWYHVPRSFLNAEGDNTLVLFEEMGGNPSLVSFQTTRVGSVCANVYENKIIELSCDRKPISAIKFASFGNPHGNCGSFEKGTCESSNNTVDILTQECVGKEKCSIDVSTKKFGAPDCSGAARKLAVEVIC
ncbi:beta-galactosidase 15-like [Brassica rapa]|uniref:beta-galactosidase 15-like n=1 Tax=Brassica campestris TaxID=3711 RepID=UPI00142DA192|nr:beta-galactosidase 15-like [Brassica rapa]